MKKRYALTRNNINQSGTFTSFDQRWTSLYDTLEEAQLHMTQGIWATRQDAERIWGSGCLIQVKRVDDYHTSIEVSKEGKVINVATYTILNVVL